MLSRFSAEKSGSPGVSSRFLPRKSGSSGLLSRFPSENRVIPQVHRDPPSCCPGDRDGFAVSTGDNREPRRVAVAASRKALPRAQPSTSTRHVLRLSTPASPQNIVVLVMPFRPPPPVRTFRDHAQLRLARGRGRRATPHDPLCAVFSIVDNGIGTHVFRTSTSALTALGRGRPSARGRDDRTPDRIAVHERA